jgi:RimJ/RimL family protein N-acetyltransferase
VSAVPELPLLERELRGECAALRPYAERDIPEILIAYQDDPELHLRLGERRPPSGAELGREFECAEAERRAGRRLLLTITAPGDDRCLGRVAVHSVDWKRRCAELALWVAPGARRQGRGSEALALAARWLLAHGGLARLELRISPRNEAMVRAAAAAGAVRLGEAEAGLLRYGIAAAAAPEAR